MSEIIFDEESEAGNAKALSMEDDKIKGNWSHFSSKMNFDDIA